MRTFSKYQNAENNPYLRNKEEADKFLNYCKQRNVNNAALNPTNKPKGQTTMNANDYDKVKATLNKSTDLNLVNQVLQATMQHRDQLNEVIELALDKQAALTSSDNIEKW